MLTARIDSAITPPDEPSAGPPFFIAGDVALDFLNSTVGQASGCVEGLADDLQVLAWLAQAGLSTEQALTSVANKPGSLHKAALALREHARDLVQQRSAGHPGQPELLNRLLARGHAYSELHWHSATPELRARQRVSRPEDLLLPVAQAIAELLAHGDFSLIRKCESPDCTLWFYDRTKSHKRRWCSMAVCGNRMKVAAFRARQKND
ncbi:MAG: CGNR zinc finger domain-containing protein [Burkholderiales bacterium]